MESKDAKEEVDIVALNTEIARVVTRQQELRVAIAADREGKES